MGRGERITLNDAGAVGVVGKEDGKKLDSGRGGTGVEVTAIVAFIEIVTRILRGNWLSSVDLM